MRPPRGFRALTGGNIRNAGNRRLPCTVIVQILGMADTRGAAIYRLEDVKAHDSAEDCWLVIAGKVYDVTSWVPSHPGGSMIYLQAGRDSTHLFDSYHPLYVRKLLSRYYIGDFQDENYDNIQYMQPFEEKFYTTLKERVESFFDKFKLDARVHPHMFLKSALIFVGLTFCYYTTFYRQQHFLFSLFSAAGMGFFIAEIGLSIMHDANHGAYSRYPLLGYIMGASLDIVGASSFMWKYQHVVGHHSFTNVHNYDPDIRVKDPDIRRVTSKQPWHDYHMYQHVYLAILYGLLALKSIFLDDFVAYFNGRIGPVKVPKMTPVEFHIFWWGKAVYATYMLVLPLLFSYHNFLSLLVCYLVSQLVTGWMLALLFQVAHVVEEAEFFDVDCTNGVPTLSSGWAALQVRTTANFSVNSLFWTHVSGGLNHQIEHHLFPAICHLHYPRIQPIVESTCKEFGIPYHRFPDVWTALKAHFAYLKKVGGSVEFRLAG
ncbi:acyl-lipid (8-3)-desaturase [Selaginella moellendorffii]|nr:acyl-lipid (8-3)-desaturase [Selaginella moellendorffii]|eukprot:XP_002988231.2 acyl-lipid (8-3)-desaturase [Selaginella moellendorffii]